MAREIKFRAWWKHPEYCITGKMYHVGGLVFAKKQDGEPEFDDCSTPKEVGLMHDTDNSKMGWNDADECILMQCTDLKDKNGKEIYEGDIVGSKYGNSKPSEVKWGLANIGTGPRKLCYHISDYFGDDECTALGEDVCGATDWLEVIGNIYENPDLIA